MEHGQWVTWTKRPAGRKCPYVRSYRTGSTWSIPTNRWVPGSRRQAYRWGTVWQKPGYAGQKLFTDSGFISRGGVSEDLADDGSIRFCIHQSAYVIRIADGHPDHPSLFIWIAADQFRVGFRGRINLRMVPATGRKRSLTVSPLPLYRILLRQTMFCLLCWYQHIRYPSSRWEIGNADGGNIPFQ